MESEAAHKDLVAAEKALKDGKYDQAERMLDLAAHAGAEPLHISNLGRRVRAARAVHESRVKSSIRYGFFIALAGYAVLSFRQPMAWGQGLWFALAFCLVPAIAGLFVGIRHAGERTHSLAFRDGLGSGTYAMLVYSAFNLIVLADHLQAEASQAAAEYFAAFVSVLAFSAIAGVVAGVVSVLVSLIRPREAQS